MKISKKILAVLLSAIMVLSIMPVSGYAESVADYKEINSFLSQAQNLDRSIYMDESLDLLDSVIEKIDFNLTSSEQSVVDGWADELEEALENLKFDVSKADADILVDLSDKKLSAGDILTVTVMLTSNFYITNVQLPILFDKTQFEVVGNTANKSYYTVAPMFSSRGYTFGGRADRQQGFDKTSNPEKWNTDAAKAQYGVAYITASFNPMEIEDDDTYAKPQNDVFITFELKALVDVSDALVSVFISSDWAKTATNKTGLLAVGMTTGEVYGTTAESVSYTNISYATSTAKHYYQTEIIEPTCTETGYTKYSCTECDYSYTADFVEALGHEKAAAVEENYKEEDCENDGSYDKVIYCKVCGEELSREKIAVPAYGHIEGDVVTENRIESDCENDGSYDEVIYCEVCGEEISRNKVTVPAYGHIEGDVVTENRIKSDCENDGSYETVTYCFICEKEMSRVKTTVPKLGHKYVGKVTSPTCTEKGYTTYTCSRCDDSYVADYVEPAGHKNAEPIKEDEQSPACEAEGSFDSVVYCSVCGAEVSREEVIVPATGHTEKEETQNTFEPTCEEDGSYDTVVSCTVCGKELSRVTTKIPALGHDYSKEAVAPTCTEQGCTIYTCTRCSHEYTSDFVSELGHTAGEWREKTAPDCETEGVEELFCSVCEAYMQERKIPAPGHTEVIIPSVAPTCTTSGLTEGKKCAVCDEILAVQEFVPAGHDYMAVVTPPTREEQGYTTYTCKGCGDSYIDDIVDKLTGFAVSGIITGFSNESEAVTVELTPKDKTGYTYTTTIYGGKTAEFFFDFVVKGEYTMTVLRENHAPRTYDVSVNDKAVSVDAKIHLCGDITGDGKVNAIDVARANAYAKGYFNLAGYELDCANINGDAVVNAIDVALMNAHAKGAKPLW